MREIAASKIPVVTGIGHEIDETLADLVSDIRGSTPSNVAEILTPDRKIERRKILDNMKKARVNLLDKIEHSLGANREKVEMMRRGILTKYVEPVLSMCVDKIQKCTTRFKDELNFLNNEVKQKIKLLEALNPENVLRQGYAIISGKIDPGIVVKITTITQEIEAEVKKVKERKK